MRNVTVFVAASLLATCLVRQSLPGQEQLVVTARIWPYKSLCDFQDPPNVAQFAGRYRDIYEVRIAGCKFLVGHPQAVRITIANRRQSMYELEINENPGDATITRGEGTAVHAIALRVVGASSLSPTGEGTGHALPGASATVSTTVSGGTGFITLCGATIRELKANFEPFITHLVRAVSGWRDDCWRVATADTRNFPRLPRGTPEPTQKIPFMLI
jgi:hypothetical protein